MHNQKQQRPAVQRALSFADDGCNKSFSKDGKDGKDDVSAMGGMHFCQDMPISTWS
jgi:hypothetical protein